MLRTSSIYTGWCLALLTVAALGAGTARAQVGLAAGANLNQLTDIEGDPQATFDNAIGYHVGVFYDLAFGPLGIRPGVFYVKVGSFDAAVDEIEAGSFDLNMIEVPVDVRLRTTAPVVRPYVLGGPVFRFASADDADFDASLSNSSVAAHIGLGVEIGALGTGVKVYPEVRYAFGLTRITDDFTFLGREFSTDTEQQLNTFMVRLGLAF